VTEPTIYSSLDEAMRLGNIPWDNHPTVRGIVEAIGIETLYAHNSSGIRAVRREPGPDLWIAYGNTSGFVSEEEARCAAPELQPWPDNKSGSRWGVTHPENKNRDGGGMRRERPAAETCPRCFTEKASDGSCLCD